MDVPLSDAQIELYSRQILLREVGGRGQKRLLAASALLLGGGEAVAVAATYLAGAGVGHLDLAPASAAGEAGGLELAPLDQRNPDVRIRRLESLPEALDGYDAVIAEGHAAARLAEATGHPRCGEIRIDTRADDATAVVVIPAGATACAVCAECAVSAERDDAPPAAPSRSDPLAADAAGALAALAACRWLTGIAATDEPVAWRLAPSAPTWEAVPIATGRGCPRGCRS